MNLPLSIARRYLFAKKSTNAINIISGISVFGISVGTAALVLVLSVFNGFEDLLTGLFNSFNPDIKITIAQGKTFTSDPEKIAQLKALPGVDAVSETLEETAFFEYEGNEGFGIVKGVDKYYKEVTNLDSTIREGVYELGDGERDMAIMGVGMRNKLSINIDNYLATLNVYMAKEKTRGPLDKAFRKQFVYPVGTFVIQQDFDSQYVISSLDFARRLLKAPDKVSALELKLNDKVDPDNTKASIQKILGEAFIVKDRYQQDEAFLKLMNIEKWMSFAILSLMLVLIAFNLIGALWMIVLDKRKDIAILKAMGAKNLTIRNIFLNEGLLLSILGITLGFGIAILLYVIQKTFGIVPIPSGFVVDAYPISMRFSDFVVIAITVAVIGLMASIPPALRAARISAITREE